MMSWNPDDTVRDLRAAVSHSGEHAWRQLLMESFEGLTTEVKELRKEVYKLKFSTANPLNRTQVSKMIENATAVIRDRITLFIWLAGAAATGVIGMLLKKAFF